jgi:hypothetical protein
MPRIHLFKDRTIVTQSGNRNTKRTKNTQSNTYPIDGIYKTKQKIILPDKAKITIPDCS